MSRRQTTLMLAAAMFLEAVGYGIAAPTLPFIARELGADELHIGVLLGLYALVGVIGVLPLAILADRFGRRMLIFLGLGSLAIGSLGFAQAPTLAMLYAARFIQGLGGNAIWVGGLSMQGDLSTREGMAKSLSWLTASWSLGFMIGPLLGGLVGSFRTPYYVYAAVSVLALLGSVLYLRESYRSGSAFKVEKFLGVLMMPNLWVSGTVVLLMAAFYGAFEAFVPTYLADRGVARSMLGWLFCGLSLPTILLPPLVARLSDFLGDSRLLRLTLPSWAVLVGGSVYLLDFLHPMFTFVVLGAAEVLIYMPSVAILHRPISMELRGSASSANNFMFSLGFLIGPSLIGAVIADIGHHSAFLAIGFAGFAGTLFVRRTLRRLEGIRPGAAPAGLGAALERPLEPPT